MKKINVNGRVQGVAFRYFTKRKALELDIVGTVENLSDGSVLIYADGLEIEAFVKWCKKGPKSANVNNVTVEDVSLIEVIDNFTIVR